MGAAVYASFVVSRSAVSNQRVMKRVSWRSFSLYADLFSGILAGFHFLAHYVCGAQ